MLEAFQDRLAQTEEMRAYHEKRPGDTERLAKRFERNFKLEVFSNAHKPPGRAMEVVLRRGWH